VSALNPPVWQVNYDYYPSWKAFAAEMKGEGIRMLTYMNPYLVDVKDKFPHRRNLFREAIENGYLIKNASGPQLVLSHDSRACVRC
jgi:sulfoquinovosidase